MNATGKYSLSSIKGGKNPNTIKVLQASAHAALETGAVVLIHPGFDPDSPPAIIETLTGAGLDPSRIIMGHLELIPTNFAWLKDLAQSGCYMEWDVFGEEDTTFADGASGSDVESMRNIEYFHMSYFLYIDT